MLAAWAGLGYYSRARNLRKAALVLAARGWPDTAEGLRGLPGVGAYTAAAVASLCLGERVPMVDGNAIRVLSRVHALEGDPRSGTGARRIAAVGGLVPAAPAGRACPRRRGAWLAPDSPLSARPISDRDKNEY